MIEMRTERMDLIAATLQHLDAELESTDRFQVVLGAAVPDGWPPGEYDRAAIEFLRARHAENPGSIGWYGWYALLRRPDGGGRVAVGAGGYFGPPDPSGMVEVGYSIVPAFQRQGLATELVRALIDRAFGVPGVACVRAHTYPSNVASVLVLERCGFRHDGPGEEPGTVRYVLDAPGT